MRKYVCIYLWADAEEHKIEINAVDLAVASEQAKSWFMGAGKQDLFYAEPPLGYMITSDGDLSRPDDFDYGVFAFTKEERALL